MTCSALPEVDKGLVIQRAMAQVSSILIHTQGKAVIVVGGGDTGTDCIGTSVRHGAKQAGPYSVRLGESLLSPSPTDITRGQQDSKYARSRMNVGHPYWRSAAAF